MRRTDRVAASVWLASLAMILLTACGGNDVPSVVPCNNAGADAGDASVQCPSGTQLCGSACVNVSNDPNNCGTCGDACGAGQVCSGGTCALQCPASQTVCGSACATLDSDAAN